MTPVDLGTRRELFVDGHLLDRLEGAKRRLHEPTPEEVALVHDEPWEGGGSLYHAIVEDEDRYRMYYRAQGGPDDEEYTAYAESEDGLEWEKPDVGRFEVCDTLENNVVFGPEPHRISHNLTPFRDPTVEAGSPGCYKAVGNTGDPGLFALGSPDGIEWSLLSEEPIFTREQGAFDSQNLVFWDRTREEYRAYVRYFEESGNRRRRGIKTVTSEDFEQWSEPVPLEYADDREIQLYTNGIRSYHRAPHIYLGFPVRYVERDPDSESMRNLPGWEELRAGLIEESGRSGYALTDTLFMSSRDGETFERWDRPFLRPGLWERDSTAQWVYGDNYPAWPVVETPSPEPGKPRELSLFASECYRTDAARLRRYSLRLDGFASLWAGAGGGEAVTEPLTFEGDELELNYATSAAGRLRVALLGPDGTPHPGFSLGESPDLFGDDLERTVEWSGESPVADLAGEPVRIHFDLVEADVYSFRFR